jgi:hypothetical protein
MIGKLLKLSDFGGQGGSCTPDASLFRAKMNSDYNDFVARVALEVVDSSWWK